MSMFGPFLQIPRQRHPSTLTVSDRFRSSTNFVTSLAISEFPREKQELPIQTVILFISLFLHLLKKCKKKKLKVLHINEIKCDTIKDTVGMTGKNPYMRLA